MLFKDVLAAELAGNKNEKLKLCKDYLEGNAKSNTVLYTNDAYLLQMLHQEYDSYVTGGTIEVFKQVRV